MAHDWSSIEAKAAKPGVPAVSDDVKNKICEDAYNQWKKMGLTDDQIAYGIAVIGIESGFNYTLKSTITSGNGKTTVEGLMQNKPDTWEIERKKYNNEYQNDKVTEKDISNRDAQIKVAGSQIKRQWSLAQQKVLKDKKLQNYLKEEVIYGKHHNGLSSHADNIKQFLDRKGYDGYNKPSIKNYFRKNLANARKAINKSGQIYTPTSRKNNGVRKGLLDRIWDKVKSWVYPRDPLVGVTPTFAQLSAK